MKRFTCILVALAMLICMTLPAINAVAEGTQAAIPVATDGCDHILARWEVIDSWYEPDPFVFNATNTAKHFGRFASTVERSSATPRNYSYPMTGE